MLFEDQIICVRLSQSGTLTDKSSCVVIPDEMQHVQNETNFLHISNETLVRHSWMNSSAIVKYK